MNQNIYFEDTQWKYNSSFVIAILNENCSLRSTLENPSKKSKKKWFCIKKKLNSKKLAKK